MEINEIYYSLQGETKDSGVPTIFVRTQFCPLRCVWCDSAKTWKKGEGKEMTVVEVFNAIQALSVKAKICITGGEPLRQREEVMELCRMLNDASDVIGTVKVAGNNGRYITIETDGQEDISGVNCEIDSIVMDWKVPSSGMNKMMNANNLDFLMEQDQLKFIVWTKEDLDEVEKIVPQTNAEILIGVVEGVLPTAIMESQKQNVITRLEVVEWMKDFAEKIPNKIRFQIQLHKVIWGNAGGV
jgi:7-carboxy-7-deazaguanine synthase